MANGICSGVTIEGIGSIGSEGHQQQTNQNDSQQNQSGSDDQKKQNAGSDVSGQPEGTTGQDPTKTSDHTKITQQQKTEARGDKVTKKQSALAGIIYNETGSLRPQSAKDGKPDADSAKSLTNAREAIGKVVLNREAAGKKGGVAASDVSKGGKATSQYADSLKAAKEAIDAGGSKNGPQHYYIRSGSLAVDKGKVTAGDQPSYAKGVVPSESYGPFRNPVKVGDVSAGNDIYVDIYDVP